MAHTHTGTTNSAGAHTHTYTDSYVLQSALVPGIDIDYNANTYNPNGSQTGTTSSAGSHSHTVTIASGGAHTHTLSVDNEGGGGAHENRPPYYALAYIMKT